MADETQRQKLEQGRAKHAFDEAQKVAESKSDKDKEEYNSYTKKVPMLIKTNGLGATVAYMNSKGKGYKTILEQLESWLKKNIILSEIYNSIEGNGLVEKTVNCDTAAYRALTTEAFAYLNWLKRFADGLISKT